MGRLAPVIVKRGIGMDFFVCHHSLTLERIWVVEDVSGFIADMMTLALQSQVPFGIYPVQGWVYSGCYLQTMLNMTI
jgi:hypothetical protein